MKRLPWAAILLLGALALAQEPRRPRVEDSDRRFKKWVDEDAGYIITPEETAVFKSLRTTEEKEQFIEQFWARRDSDPATAVNEFKEEHYRRITYANDNFKSAVDGWFTDRGRIYIVFGPPTSIERNPTGGTYIRPLSEGGGITDTYPFEVWHYNHIPALGRGVDLEFVDPTQTGEYRMALRETDKDALFMTPGLGMTRLEEMGLESRAGRIRSSDAGRNLGLAGDTQSGVLVNPLLKMQDYFRLRRPPSIRFTDLQAAVEAQVRYDQLPFSFRYDVLRVSQERALCPLTLEVVHRDIVAPSTLVEPAHVDVNIYGRVQRLNRQISYEFEDLISAELSPRFPGARSLYQRHLPLEPGRYKLTLALKCLQTGRMGTVETLVIVPSSSGGLETSSVIPARKIGAARAGESFPSRFTTSGGLKVYPNVSAVYEANEAIAVYAEVYNPAVDPSTRQPAVQVVGEIQADGAATPLFSQDITSSSSVYDGTKISIAKMWHDLNLPPARYWLRLRATDTIKNQTVVSRVGFEVEAGENR